MSYLLTQEVRDHIVLDRNTRVGETWRNRWDSFTLVTPNRQMQLPGHEYSGDDPFGFMTADEVVEYVESYAASFSPPLNLGIEVTAVKRAEDGGYVVHAEDGDFAAPRVVVAAGTFQHANLPGFAAGAPDEITQIHSRGYRNPDQLLNGAVLVVGSGQSGCQIALELMEAGRDVFLCVGSAGRLPRRYRGRDITAWLAEMGFLERTVDDLDDPAERFQANPHVTGRDGGLTLNLHEFARDGMTLLGRLEGLEGGQALLADDLHHNLTAADAMASEICNGVDVYIAEAGIDAPEPDLPEPTDGFDQPIRRSLDLEDAGISTILWATGHRWDFSWIEPAELDEWGYPIQRRGVTDSPGLYFVGLHWMHTLTSGLFGGVGDDAQHIVEHMKQAS